MSTHEKIAALVKANKVVLFMKGSPQAPQCGFSAQTVQCLQQAGAKDIMAIDVLADPEIRQGIKEYTNWPTIPQVFLNGQFIGGCDIVTEMHQRGELKQEIEKVLK